MTLVSRIKSKHANIKKNGWLTPAITLATIALVITKTSGFAFAKNITTASDTDNYFHQASATGTILSFLVPHNEVPSPKLIALKMDVSTSSMQLVSMETKRPILSWVLTQDELLTQTKTSMEVLESNLNTYLGNGGIIEDVKPVIENNHVLLKAGDTSLMALDGLVPLTGPNGLIEQQRQAYNLTNSLRTAYGLVPLDMPIFPEPELTPIPDDIQDGTILGPKVIRTVSGFASWYGPGFNGKRCANGERFNMNGFTAAMLHVPFGTKVRVTNKRNGKSIVVRVTDRGPFVRDRIIDLSKGAAAAIGVVSSGVAPVKVEILQKQGV